jgi:hypothetical protein
LLSPISYKENGFCSVKCSEASKIEAQKEIKIELIDTVDQANEDILGDETSNTEAIMPIEIIDIEIPEDVEID